MISIKLGISPVHFWLPQVSEGLNWLTFWGLIRWQKLIPLYIIRINPNLIIISFVICLSRLIGAINLFFVSRLRKILAFSSISHISWIASRILNNSNNWIIYLLIYAIINLRGILIIKIINISNINQLTYISNSLVKLNLVCFLLNLRGMPPFIGFFIKWRIINRIFTFNFLIVFLIIGSFIRTYFYIRLSFLFLVQNNLIIVNPKKTYSFRIIINFSLIILIPLIII